MSKVILMRLLVEPDDDDERPGEQIAEAITGLLIDNDEVLPGSGIAMATVVQEAIRG